MTAEVGEADELEHRVDALVPLAFPDLHHLEREPHVPPHGSPVVQDRALEDDPVFPAHPGGGRAFSRDGNRTRGRREQVGDDAEQGRLAAARRSQKGNELSLSDVQRHVVEGLHALVPLAGVRHADVLDFDFAPFARPCFHAVHSK